MMNMEAKYVQRHLFRDGPYVEPERIFLLDPGAAFRKRMGFADDYCSIELNGPLFAKSARTTSRSIAEQVMASEIKLPLVFKRHFEEVGRGMLFLHEHPEGIAVSYRRWPRGSEHIHFAEYIRQRGFKAVPSGDPNLSTRLLPTTDTVDWMEKLLNHATIRRTPETARAIRRKYNLEPITGIPLGSADTGMLESYIDSFKADGRAWETRHTVKGYFAPTRILELYHDCGRIGSNEFFVTIAGRPKPDAAAEVSVASVLNCLADTLDIPRNELRDYTSEKAEQGFLHLARKFEQQGWFMDKGVVWQVDFMWLPPDTGARMPRVAMSEYHIWYAGWRLGSLSRRDVPDPPNSPLQWIPKPAV
jgi:hypothetical protein